VTFRLVVLVVCLPLTGEVVFAGDVPLLGETVMLDPAGTGGDTFGSAVAIDHSTAVVGAPTAVVGNARPGSASVFVRAGGTWTMTTTLSAIDGSDADGFGQSVAVSGDTIVIGAPKADIDFVPDQGAAYVFARDPGTGLWFEQAKLTAFDGVGGDEFGRSVAIDGDLIVVGSDLISVDGEDLRGAAYVHRWSDLSNSWVQEAKLIAPDGNAIDSFGIGVSVSGDTIAVGSPGSDAAFQDQGAVYVFQFNPSFGQWFWLGRLLAPDAGQSDNLSFRNGISIHRDIIIAGAVDNGNIGAAYVFRRQFINAQQVVWIFEAKLTPMDGQTSDQFGFSISQTGGSALIGAPRADDGAVLDRGAGYFFTRSHNGQWTFRQKLVPAEGAAFDLAGWSTALSGTAALLGMPFADPNGATSQGLVAAWSCGDLIFSDGAEEFNGCGL